MAARLSGDYLVIEARSHRGASPVSTCPLYRQEMRASSPLRVPKAAHLPLLPPLLYSQSQTYYFLTQDILRYTDNPCSLKGGCEGEDTQSINRDAMNLCGFQQSRDLAQREGALVFFVYNLMSCVAPG